MFSNARSGYAGRYLRVRNKLSENGLSSLTAGRENEGMTPKRSSVASIEVPLADLSIQAPEPDRVLRHSGGPADAVNDAGLRAGQEAGAATLNYGSFIQATIDFLIIAFAIFMMIKAVNSTKKKEEEAPSAAPPKEEVLLTEIRDLLKK
jgi:hypothetical protein